MSELIAKSTEFLIYFLNYHLKLKILLVPLIFYINSLYCLI